MLTSQHLVLFLCLLPFLSLALGVVLAGYSDAR